MKRIVYCLLSIVHHHSIGHSNNIEETNLIQKAKKIAQIYL